MISIEENASLQQMNTFRIRAKTRYLVRVASEEALNEVCGHSIFKNNPSLILGGGSNVLFTKDFDGLVIKMEVAGREEVSTTEDHVVLRIGAGEDWHSTVIYCLSHDWGGIENLSLIPGTMGAAPIQNIGAYGAEIKNVIEEVRGLDLTTGTFRTFKEQECRFGYRESVFKHDLREKFFISSVTLRLTRKNHRIDTKYGAIQDTLKQHSITHPTIKDVSNAVVEIRRSKLPDPAEIGNAGSFFKNPVVSSGEGVRLKKAFPEIPSYPSDNQNVKIPAAWLIEQCGWKGKRFGEVGVHHRQALVLVNFGDGNGAQIHELATKIQRSVNEKFGVNLITEVNII